MRKTLCAAAISALLVSALLVASCGGDDDDDMPPPPTTAIAPPLVSGTPPPIVPPPLVPQGQIMVTVVANSTPPGAIVTGGGRQLGATPLQTQVPVPAPQAGQVQTFAFTFQLEGYQPATINASPVNNTISITAALAPTVVPEPVAVENTGGEEPGDDEGDDPSEIRVSGQGGGPIYDNHTTTGFAAVSQSCTISRLRVTLSGNHSYNADLHITLRDPQGNSYSLASGGQANPFRTHTVRRAAGRQAQGRWTLAIADRLAQDSGVLRGWTLRLACR